jgi:tRNA pseudouridine55 synthase
LDPAATGSLVVCVGGATKLVDALSAEDKTYEAEIALGIRTDTADGDGQVTERAGVSAAALEAAVDVVRGLHGPLMLPPPAYSAVHVQGRRAHELARAGEVVELAPREMTVLEVTGVSSHGTPGAPRDDWDLPRIRARFRVSKGSYIRSIAEEVGRRLALPSHLLSLRRVASGTLDLEGAVQPQADLREHRGRLRWWLGPDEALPLEAPWAAVGVSVVEAETEAATAALARLAHGQRLAASGPEAAAITPPSGRPEEQRWVVRGSGPEGRLIVMVRTDPAGEGRGPRLSPERVWRLPPPA